MAAKIDYIVFIIALKWKDEEKNLNLSISVDMKK